MKYDYWLLRDALPAIRAKWFGMGCLFAIAVTYAAERWLP